MNNINDIAKKIQQERKRHNLTLEELSFKSGISYNSIWKIENGIDFKMSTFIKLCDFYNINITDLFDKTYINHNINKKEVKKVIDFLQSILD